MNRDSRTEYHLITCNHPFFLDRGMGSFTLPQLISWWMAKDTKGRYVNQLLFMENLNDARTPLPINYILTPDFGASVFPVKGFNIRTWRFENYNKGSYQEYNIHPTKTGYTTDWEYYNKNPEAKAADAIPYNFDDILIDEFRDPETLRENLFDRSLKQLIPTNPEIGLEDCFCASLIAMNDMANLLPVEEQIIARKRLLDDIRRSKDGGCVSWQVSTFMYLNLAQATDRCQVREQFQMKLYLYNKNKPVNRSNAEALTKLSIAAPAIGPDGVNHKGKQDGDSDAITDNSPNNMVAGNLKMTHRQYDGTWSAGSEVRMAIVSSDLIKAAELPSNAAVWAEDMDIATHLADSIANPHIVPGTGEVISLDMQNANPFQWTPNYSEPKNCRGGNKNKIKLRVFNFNPKEFKRGDMVKITDQYSLWCIEPLAEAPDLIPYVGPVREWQFTYHITNQRYHFRYADADPEGDFDSGFHENERESNEFGMENAVALKNLAANYEYDFDGFDFSSVRKGGTDSHKGTTWPGYAQVTSFDFMGKQFGGLREDAGNALLLTNPQRDHAGDSFEQYDDLSKNPGIWTAPFFGCVFPDGYSDQAKYNTLNGPVKEEDVLTGLGWRPGRPSGIKQNDSFFDLQYIDSISENGYVLQTNPLHGASSNEKLLAIQDIEWGVFDPRAFHNNISTNYSPNYFLADSDKNKIDEDGDHVNLFSAGHNMYHVPADFATNGSWSAENGGPILNLNKVHEYITNPKTMALKKLTGEFGPDYTTKFGESRRICESFHDFWLDKSSYQWLHDTINRERNIDYDGDDISILNFTPQDGKRILFRPLKDTVYAQWDQRDDANVPFLPSQLAQAGFGNYGLGGSPRQILGQSNIGGDASLFGPKAKSRIYNYDVEDVGGTLRGHLIVTRSNNPGPKIDVADGAQFDDGIPVPSAMPFEYLLYLNNELDKIDDLEYLEEGYSSFMASTFGYGGSETRFANVNGASTANRNIRAPVGGFGVIGARCTVEANTGIQFDTNCYLGQAFRFTSQQTFEAPWGARSQLSFHQASTSQLFAKVYQGWPRDQTIFDSRFFAVHHFNQGNTMPLGAGFKRPWIEGYRARWGDNLNSITLGEPPRERTVYYDPVTQVPTGITVRAIINDQSESEQSYFPADKIATNVDSRALSYFKNPNFNNLTVEYDALEEVPDAWEGRYVYKEGISLSSSQGESSNYVLVQNSQLLEIETYVKENYAEEDRDGKAELYSAYVPIAPDDFSIVSPKRRARLLPWVQKEKTVGFDLITEIEGLPTPEQIKDNTTLRNRHLSVYVDEGYGNMIVNDHGEGYKVGDEFQVQGGSGGNAIARVTELRDPEIGSVGALEWVTKTTDVVGVPVNRFLAGEDFSQSDFPSAFQQNITTETKSRLAFVPVSGTNRTFKAFLVAGMIREKLVIDHKPQIASREKAAITLGIGNNTQAEAGQGAVRTTDDFQIIPFVSSPVALGGPATTTYQKAQFSTDPANGRKTSSIVFEIDSEKSNPNVTDGEYNIFFQYHADITHVNQRLADVGAYENFIELIVTPYLI